MRYDRFLHLIIGAMWYVCSGAVNKAITHEGYYQRLLDQHRLDRSVVAEAIEQVSRTSFNDLSY